MSTRPGIFVRLLVCGIVLAIAASIPGYSADRPILSEEPVVLDKASHPVTTATREFLAGRDGDTVKIWVFFTDKAVFSRSDFARAASSVTLTERALRRRAKVGLDKVVFADLPVAPDYIDRIVDLGATHRRTSRWLNAASFEAPMDRLDDIGSLPFVTGIKPIAAGRKVEPVSLSDLRDTEGYPTAQAPDALNYGASVSQLTQINVPAVHDKGYSGQGVTLAIMDTGFRKSHQSFAFHWSESRVLAEWDFVFNDGNTANETGDVSNQWNHGTYIWSTSGGELDGTIYGPAYKANFILCKTEDLRSETPVEEDNWVAALEFADSVGTDVITTSLGYMRWDDASGYTYEDMDGATATISIAAGTCDGLGIVMCNSMGNDGPALGTLTAPADAFDILSIGAVTSVGSIASFSSRGPTSDGRPKPDVCARGVSTYCASASSDFSYAYVNGTSLSTPLVAGAVCLVIEARPDFTPAMVREALRETASKAGSPDSTTYGWGIINVDAAIAYDQDADGYGELTDNCPAIYNPGQEDADGDEVGDVCDDCTDTDGDGYGNPGFAANTCAVDNCPDDFNPDQADADSNGVGNVCESCCLGITGNIDGDEEEAIDIGDLTRLIDYLFITQTELECMPEGNTDGDEEGDVDIGDLTALIDYLFISNTEPSACQ